MPRSWTLDKQLDDLLGDLYDAAVDSERWTGIAARIAVAFGSTSAVVKLHGGDGVRLLETTDNLVVPDARKAWAEYWHRRDLWVERSLAFGLSRIVTDQELVSESEQRRSGFYQEWLRELEIHHMIGAVFPAGVDRVGVLGIHRPRAAGPYGDGARRQLARLLPHLQRALTLGDRFAALALSNATAWEALDRLDAAVLALDRGRRIVYASARAERLLSACHELQARGSQMRLRDPALDSRFSAIVRDSIDTASGRLRQPESVLAIPRDGRPPLAIAVAPLGPRWWRLNGHQPLALVFLRDAAAVTIDLDHLRALFGLTRAEAAVAADLVQGRPQAEIAVRRGVGLETIRSHLKRILAKTGARRQAEAVAIIVRSVGPSTDRP